MSTELYFTNDKNKLNKNLEFTEDDINYLDKRLSYLEKIIQTKYSDILYLVSEICNLNNINLKYDLVDLIIKHGSNLSKYKAELIDIKDSINSFNNLYQKPLGFMDKTKNQNIIDNDIENIKPHDSNNVEIKEEVNLDIDVNKITNDDKNEPDCEEDGKLTKKSVVKNISFSNPRVVKDTSRTHKDKDKNEIAREKIISNLDKLILYKENTFNDLIEMVDFHTDSTSSKIDLSKFIENLENQIVELNEYKNNILKNYSLSKSIELGSNGKITFSRIFIEKERLVDKNKDEYIKVLEEMHELYSEFVDNYLKNINYMKPHLNPEKINSMQNNCAKVIYDLKLIRNLYSSLDKIKGV